MLAATSAMAQQFQSFFIMLFSLSIDDSMEMLFIDRFSSAGLCFLKNPVLKGLMLKSFYRDFCYSKMVTAIFSIYLDYESNIIRECARLLSFDPRR